MENIFLPNKKERVEKIAAARLATIKTTRWTGNRSFF